MGSYLNLPFLIKDICCHHLMPDGLTFEEPKRFLKKIEVIN